MGVVHHGYGMSNMFPKKKRKKGGKRLKGIFSVVCVCVCVLWAAALFWVRGWGGGLGVGG